MILLQDIFKILLQPVQLLIAVLMFTCKEPKRKLWLIRAVLAAILGFLVLKLCINASPEILLNSFLASLVWSIGSFLILLSIEYSMFDVELKMAAYFTTLAYLTQHVAFCAWDAIQPGAGYNEPHYCSLKDIVVDTFIPFAVFALVYVVIYLLIARPMVKHGYASVSVGYGIAILQVENFYEGDLRFVDGLPVTTKGDPNYHGFGLKSIRSTAEKYGGTVSVQAEDGLFLLRVALPVETE